MIVRTIVKSPNDFKEFPLALLQRDYTGVQHAASTLITVLTGVPAAHHAGVNFMDTYEFYWNFQTARDSTPIDQTSPAVTKDLRLPDEQGSMTLCATVSSTAQSETVTFFAYPKLLPPALEQQWLTLSGFWTETHATLFKTSGEPDRITVAARVIPGYRRQYLAAFTTIPNIIKGIWNLTNK